MEKPDDIYRALQRHLDRQPVGFPAAKSGSDIRLLKRLFAPEEARLAMLLSYKPRTVKDIHGDLGGTGMSLDRLSDALNAMARKLTIGRVERKGVHCYYNTPLVVGMYEGQLYHLSPEFLKDFREYSGNRAFGLEFLSSKLPQMRTIPVEKSIRVEHCVSTYDELTTLIGESRGPFVINECICRKVAGLRGNPCKKTARLETCLALGGIAQLFSDVGEGREVSREEALEISRMNEEDGLVLQPANAQKAEFVCACCGCCCGMLGMQKSLRRPVDFWASNFRASVKTEICTGCGTCAVRCQVGAVTVGGKPGTAAVDRARCIGCGNCVPSCLSGAMSLVKREKELAPPETQEDLYEVIMKHKKGTPGKLLLAARLVLQSAGAKKTAKGRRV